VKELVLEVGVEGLPPAVISPALAEMRQLLGERLRQENLRYQEIQTYGTPRRLVACITGVAPRQPDTVIEVRGPSAQQAFDSFGNYTYAAFSFARTQDVFPEELKVKRITGGEYLFVERPKPGRPTVEVAAGFLPELITSLAFPKTVRWQENPPRSASPIRWVLALYGEEVIPFQIGDVESGRSTRGHRALHGGTLETPATIEVPEAAAYLDLVRAAGVILDPEERRQRILEQARALAQAEGGQPLDGELADGLTFLVEQPTAFAGGFDPAFLALPREALVLVMRKQQRLFPVVGPEDALLPRFIGIYDGGSDGVEDARAGQEEVLHARLSDLRFSYEEDLRVPLPERVEALRGILYQERLGTLYEKTERLGSLTAELCDRWGVDATTRQTALRAALLAKADLATDLLKELPELRGRIGQAYALHAGEPSEVADALAGHYLPREAGDALPPNEAGRILGAADRIDTLVGHFGMGLVPIGSQDPHALRQQASGLVAILAESERLSLGQVVEVAYALYGDRGPGWRSLDVTRASLLDFLRQCLEGLLGERGVRYDTADAVLDAGFDDVRGTLIRAQLLEEQRDAPEFADTLMAAARLGSLLRFVARSEMAVPPGEVRIDLLQEEAEQLFYAAYLDVYPLVTEAVERGDYAAALDALGGLAVPALEFFDNVLVTSDDELLRANRVRLLGEIHALFLKIADLTRLTVEIE
jgi:glycyl-tRNA synthetase beta chain